MFKGCLIPLLALLTVLSFIGWGVYSLIEPCIVDNDVEAEILAIIEDADLSTPERWDSDNGKKLEPEKIVIKIGYDGEHFSPITGEDLTEYRVILIYDSNGDYDAYLRMKDEMDFYPSYTLKQLRENINEMFWY